MGFRDPIVSGEELIRSAISSEDFATGAAGWRIARDGQAEFNSMSVRSTVSVDKLIVAGDDLSTVIDRPRRYVGYHARTVGSPTTAVGTPRSVMRLNVSLTPGRNYKIHAEMPIYINGATGGFVEAYIRYTTDGTNPTLTSPILRHNVVPYPPGGIPVTIPVDATVSFAPTVTDLRLLVNFLLQTPTGATGAMVGDTLWPAEVWVKEDGPTLADTGANDDTGGGAALVYKTFDIQPYASRCYAGNGDPVGGAGAYDNKYCMSGDIHIDGNRRSWMWFDANKNTGGNGLGSMNDMQGMGTLDYFEVFLYFPHWYTTAGGRTTIGYHNINVVTQWEQLNGVYGQKEAFWEGRNIGKWVNLKGTGIETAARNGTFEGLILGNTGDANINNYGYAYGANGVIGQMPGLRAGYYK